MLVKIPLHAHSYQFLTLSHYADFLIDNWQTDVPSPVCTRQREFNLCNIVFLKLKFKTNLYSAIKSEDLEAFDGGTSQLSSKRECGEIKIFWGCFQ